MEEVAEGLVDTRNGQCAFREEQNPFKGTDACKVGQPEPKKAELPKTEAPKAEPAKAETAKASKMRRRSRNPSQRSNVAGANSRNRKTRRYCCLIWFLMPRSPLRSRVITWQTEN